MLLSSVKKHTLASMGALEDSRERLIVVEVKKVIEKKVFVMRKGGCCREGRNLAPWADENPEASLEAVSGRRRVRREQEEPRD